MEQNIGALWVKKTKKGDDMFSISIGTKGNEQRFIAFENKGKKSSNHPDFLIYESQPTTQRSVYTKRGSLDNLEEDIEIKPEDLPF